MTLTEAEALTKWCPFTRVYVYAIPIAREVMLPSTAGGPGNRYLDGATSDTNPAACRCIASACMSWKWMTVDDGVTVRKGTCGMASVQPGQV